MPPVPTSLINSVCQTVCASPSPMLLFAADDALTLLYANEAHVRMTGRGVTEIVGKPMFEAFAPNPESEAASAEEAIRGIVNDILESGAPSPDLELQHDLPTEDGVFEQRFWSVIHWPVHHDGKIAAILQRSQDVTEEVRARKLVAAEKRAAEQSAGISFFSYDPETDLFERSPGIDAMFGFAHGEAGEHANPFFERVSPEDLPAVHKEVARAMAGGAGTPAAFDYRVLVPGEQKARHIRVRAGIERDPDDAKLKLFGAFVEMSDIEHARAELAELSKRNAALVVESNHRIKNSLAIASAMLAQQLRASDDPSVQEALRLAATRIAAIADVHGELFKDAGVEQVAAGSLIEQFARSFSRTIDGNADQCRIAIRCDEVILPSHYAVTIALALNELLTNAVKYGMSVDNKCQIKVALIRSVDTVTLRVSNQIASQRIGTVASQGVGTRLITAFARQLEGSIDTGVQGDTFEAQFKFPIPDAGDRRDGSTEETS
ncbi:histidine kinase dimerization/phosphoacceptor domain -containing protein [Qipengyuania sp. XHP0207]|uniref:sensor histidine kinase n=1 Tax=Qipengyuania sp. XHP0207 TaxID=3038078 RepID=UPI00241DC9A6|nr:histidine kinase dimerization/phosphoacceptor domain -containing protein [Qipengyuania sp. XHP0207]MDG5746600.1 histidine kinase dimerization/phosphoacceptor domain -containing protein [Qipengyuania sp. XHP0207]